MFENCVNKDFPPYFVETAGHNNIEKHAKDYLARINAFIEHVDGWVHEQEMRAVEEMQQQLNESQVAKNAAPLAKVVQNGFKQ